MDRLIQNIENGIVNKSEFIHTIRNPRMLIKSLKDLDGMIGNNNIKDKVAAQIVHLMAQRMRKDKKPVMLHSLLYGGPGVGKCLAKDTPVRMYDGSTKKVQDITASDLLMGDDSNPRRVLSTTSGKELMYKIEQEYGDNYTVNESHVISLKLSKDPYVIKGSDFIAVEWYDKSGIKSHNFPPDTSIEEILDKLPKKGDVIDIEVRDYIKQDHQWKKAYKGFKVGVEYPEKMVEINSYVFGSLLKDEFLTDNYIPKRYLINSREARLGLLAGIIDTHNSSSIASSYNFGSTKCYIISHDMIFGNDIIELARSLGFMATLSLHNDDKLYRIKIKGNLETIPCRYCKFSNSEDVLSYDIKVVQKEVGDYYGFTIDGNHRFLLGDYTVTHNTVIGTHLARIWYSLGYINGKKIDKPSLVDGLMSGDDSPENLQSMMAILTVIILLMTILGYVAAMFKKCYDCMGMKWFLIIVSILAIIAIILLFMYVGRSSPTQRTQTTTLQDRIIDSANYPLDDDIIKIVSREDLIGQYLGWTAKKTKEVLEKNIGKVLFIDEAYSLVNGERDMFGNECLDTINRFMSENPDKIIVIMAGYKDKINDNIFSAQPGLKRRFMWSFNCPGYTPEELFEIWKQQISPWTIEDEHATKELFLLYKEAFPNMAGDTLRLSNYTQIAHSSSLIEGFSNIEQDVLTLDHVSQGIQTLLENNMECDDSDEKEKMAKMFEKLSKFAQ